ncbi:MAG TPA: hypothetical protein DCE41_05715 [Cytophagales bacterium]|nr:hypothetical protein [Cytophagales bacterium]HAA21365.1 hypothetical protein [Cytophagales bacterium]
MEQLAHNDTKQGRAGGSPAAASDAAGGTSTPFLSLPDLLARCQEVMKQQKALLITQPVQRTCNKMLAQVYPLLVPGWVNIHPAVTQDKRWIMYPSAALQQDLGIAPNTLTAHLNVLVALGWFTWQRHQGYIELQFTETFYQLCVK